MAEQAQGLAKTRRRLSVVSDNKLVEGLESLNADLPESGEGQSCAVSSYAGVSKKGYAPYNPRKKNQDSVLMKEDPETQSLLLCVFDGHGEAGDAVSQYFRNQMPAMLFSDSKFKSSDPAQICEAIKSVTLKLEGQIKADPSVDTEFSGTTAVMNVVRGNLLIVANIGDSRISKGTKQADGTILASNISIDHKPELPEEKARIESVGGRVFAVQYDDGIDGPARVWLGHMDVPGLAMSRSLCDTVAHTAGVSSEPEFFVVTLTPADTMLVIATDGLWEFMSDQEVIDIMHTPEHRASPRKAVDTLIRVANKKWMDEEQVIDDTTVIVAHLKVAEAYTK